MKPFLILLTVLTVAAPAHAQSRQLRLYGNLAGEDYCTMRAMGVPHEMAFRSAIERNVSHRDTEPVLQTPQGRTTTMGAVDFARYVFQACPSAWPSRQRGVEL